MNVEIPDSWQLIWSMFDARFAELKRLMDSGGKVSSADITAFFRPGLESTLHDSAAFKAWMAIRHNCTRNEQLRDVLRGDRPTPAMETPAQPAEVAE